MDLLKLIEDAELNLFFMSGSGAGAFLLTAVALAVVWRSKSGEGILRALGSVSGTFPKRK